MFRKIFVVVAALSVTSMSMAQEPVDVVSGSVDVIEEALSREIEQAKKWQAQRKHDADAMKVTDEELKGLESSLEELQDKVDLVSRTLAEMTESKDKLPADIVAGMTALKEASDNLSATFGTEVDKTTAESLLEAVNEARKELSQAMSRIKASSGPQKAKLARFEKALQMGMSLLDTTSTALDQVTTVEALLTALQTQLEAEIAVLTARIASIKSGVQCNRLQAQISTSEAQEAEQKVIDAAPAVQVIQTERQRKLAAIAAKLKAAGGK